MSVGGVGGAGSGAGVSAGSAAGVGGAGSPSGAVSGGEGVTSSSCEGTSSKDISDVGDKAGNTTYNITQIQNNNMFSNISTQDSMELYSCVQQSNESTEMDLQKLIELMIIMKLLESMNESSSSSGGFSTVA